MGTVQANPSRLTVVAFMNAFTEGMSGGDAWFIEVARRWTDVRLVVVTSKLGQDACAVRGLNAQFIVTTDEQHFKGVARTYLQRILRAFALRKVLSSVDVVFSTSDAPPDVLPAWLIARRRKDILWVQRICHITERRRGRLLAWSVQAIMHRAIRSRASLVLPISQTLASQLVDRRFKREAIVVSLPGVARSSRGSALRSRESVDEAGSYAGLFVGRLHPSKGIFDLPRIWAEVLRDHPGARLAIVGHGTEDVRKKMASGLRSLGIERLVDILGFVSIDQLEAIYGSSQVFLFTSHEEGFGMAILDALVRGVPVVCWNLPIYREHFGEAVVAVPEGDCREFARAVTLLLRDPAAYRRRAEAGAALAASRSWDSVAAEERRLLTGT